MEEIKIPSSKIAEDALDKYRRGEKKHGVFDPAIDKRDLLLEDYDELLDAANYLRMWRMQIIAQRPSLWANPEIIRKWNYAFHLVIEATRANLELQEEVKKNGNGK